VKPLASLDASGIDTLLFDIDETLTTQGKLTAAAYSALERLKRAGRRVVPITGRPAGWCDHIARMWPVDAVVGENGAFWFRMGSESRVGVKGRSGVSESKLLKRYVVGDGERARRAERMGGIAQRILREVPGCAIASDQPYREADLAIDFREDVAELPREGVRRIVAIMEEEGLTAKVSSIHVNGWFGGYDKLSTARRMLREDFAVDADAERMRIVFAGDSPNDQPMFEFFPNAVGVANVRDMADLMTHLPAWVTPSRGSAGFAELARALLLAREEVQ
jgi:HAD superfamily hydrolase (TIGR01484 family)